MQHVIISDSSCVILFKNIGKLDVLEKLYGQILITPEIAKEISEQLPNWIVIKKATDQKYQTLISL